MADQVKEQKSGKHFIAHLALITAVILFPGLNWALLGWLHVLLPLVVFYYLYRFGTTIGWKYLLTASIISTICSIFLQALPLILFSVTMFPSGYMLAQCAINNESVIQSGIKATISVLAGWLFFLLILSLSSDSSIYGIFIQSLETGVNEAIRLYRENGTFSPETLLSFEQTLRNLQVLLPKILPALFVSMAIIVIWIGMSAGNYFLLLRTNSCPWPRYQLWTLPEKLVWVFIASTLMFLVPGTISATIGANLLIVSGLLYCIQGFSIVVYFFSKWNLPRFARTIFYIMILFQSIGTIIILGLGLTNTWFDYRKIKLSDQTHASQ